MKDREFRVAIKCLESSGSVKEALEKMQRQIGRKVAARTLRDAFAARNMPSPSTFLAPSLPEEKPAERRERKVETSRLRREIDELVDQLREARAREEVLRACRSTPVIEIPRREFSNGRREAAAVAMLSDLHVEETVTLAQSGGVNEFNLEIADASLARFFEGCNWLNNLYRDRFGVRDMVLALLGDLLTGYIHEELVETNSLSPVETVLWLRDRLIAGIRSLLADNELERLHIPCVPGNHGRTTQKIRRSTYSENSYEWLLYQMLAHEFRDEERVVFSVDKSPHKWFQVYDFTVHVCHGDDVRYYGGVGGLSIPLGKRIPAWDRLRRAHYHLLGHFHTFRDFQNAVVNGSLIGYSAYALSIGADPEPPTQGYFLIDSKRGKTAVHPIWVRAS